MADYTITVTFSGGVVSADPSSLQVKHDPGVQQTIEWVRADSSFALNQVIFLRPVGDGHPIGVPQAGANDTITVTDDNSNPYAQPDTYKYLVLIEQGGVVFPSPDPEILNEPGGGAEEGDEDDEDGG